MTTTTDEPTAEDFKFSRDKWLTTARSLMAKAQDKGTPKAEAEALYTRAMELMAKHGITQAMIDAEDNAGKDRAAGISEKGLKIRLESPYARDRGDLLWSIAQPLRVIAVLLTHDQYACRKHCDLDDIDPAHLHVRRKQKVYTMHLIGFESDIQRVQLLYTSLSLQLTKELLDGPTIADLEAEGQDFIAWRASYVRGFASAIYSRLAAAERAAKIDLGVGSGTDLVLADRFALVERHKEKLYPVTGSAARSAGKGTGTAAGWAAGQRASIGGRTSVGSTGPKGIQ